MVQSTLRFSGRDRPNGNQLIPSDSGSYLCVFENDVKRVESAMNLRVERKFLFGKASYVGLNAH